MNKLLRKACDLQLPGYTIPLALLAVCLLSYALLIRYLGFYWDDYPLAWIAAKMGPAGLARYFSTNRPFWGLLYQITTPILGSDPFHWQVFAIFWRWWSAVALWALLRQVWRDQPQIALFTSLFFCVYPAFGQQYVSFVYSHFFIVLAAFFTSLLLTLLAIRRKGNPWLLSILALVLSLVNLMTMEYFFLLELIRPVFIWAALGNEREGKLPGLKRALVAWTPYLALFLLAVGWRAFFFRFQTQNYQPVFLQLLSTQPLQALLLLAGNIARSIWYILVSAWLLPFTLPDPAQFGARTILYVAILVLFSGLFIFTFLWLRREENADRKKAGEIVAVGAVACLLGGGPFWLIDQIPQATFPLDRFSLPFVLGSGLILTGVLLALPVRNGLRLAVVSVLVCLAIGYQFRLGIVYRRDWEVQQKFFWQLSWRAPALQPGTLLIVNLPVTYYTDNSLTAPLNWMYASQVPDQDMAFMLFYPNVRINTKLAGLQEDTPVAVDYLATEFSGSTSQAVAINFNPPGCLRVLDPGLDNNNDLVPEIMRRVALVSKSTRILPAPAELTAQLPIQLSGPEPVHDWCYYFERADLAAQQGNWEKVASLGEQAIRGGYQPKTPGERIPFIEAYAHLSDWQEARQQSQTALADSALMEPVLCQLWDHIARDTSVAPDQQDRIQAIQGELGCS